MRYVKGWFANLPEERGHIPSTVLSIDHAKDFLYKNASIIGLGIAIATMVVWN